MKKMCQHKYNQLVVLNLVSVSRHHNLMITLFPLHSIILLSMVCFCFCFLLCFVDWHWHLWFDHFLKLGNPFLVNVLPSTDKPIVTGSALHYSPVDQIARLTIHNVDSENDIIAKVQGTNKEKNFSLWFINNFFLFRKIISHFTRIECIGI